MVNKLFNAGKSYGAIAIVFLLTNAGDCFATEYVFTAPPEVDREIVEIPASDTDYPLYECSNETSSEENDVLDSHDCICTDCEERLEDAGLDTLESTSETEAEQL